MDNIGESFTIEDFFDKYLDKNGGILIFGNE